MNIITSLFVLVVAFSLSAHLVFADEMNMHDQGSAGAKAADMGMADAEHKAIEMKAHQKYDATVKKAESEYASELKKSGKAKNPAAAISAAKKKLQKVKADADALYRKERDAGMKKAAKQTVKPTPKPTAKKPIPKNKPMPSMKK